LPGYAPPARRTAAPAPPRVAGAASAPRPASAPPARRSEAQRAGHARLLEAWAGAAAPVAPFRTAGPQPLQSATLPNRTGLPDRLKRGAEALSGLSMDDVRVHRNSREPAKLGALAFARGNEIHLGPGEDAHLPHEMWHVVQQKQGRVKATARLKSEGVNTDIALEAEADRASAMLMHADRREGMSELPRGGRSDATTAQLKVLYPEAEWDAGIKTMRDFVGTDHDLINAAEPTQIPELARSLGQDFVKYTPGTPPNLAGERINYLVGHVTFGNDGKDELDPEWARQGPAAIVRDLVAGNIEAGSTLKILGCRAGVSLASQIATRLAAAGKAGVSVIASPHIVHATGVGIVSFPMKNPQQGGALTTAYGRRNNSGKKLVKTTIPDTRKELEEARGKLLLLRQAAREQVDAGGDFKQVEEQLKQDTAPLRQRIRDILDSFLAAGQAHFDRTVEAFSEGYKVAPSHDTPSDQGWRKFVDNDVALDVSPEDARPDRPQPVVLPQVGAEPDGPQQPLLPQGIVPQPVVPEPLVAAHLGPQVPVNPLLLRPGWTDATRQHPLL
jgi:hypothetical protein